MTTHQGSTATANANGGGTITKQGRTPRTTPFDMSLVAVASDGGIDCVSPDYRARVDSAAVQ